MALNLAQPSDDLTPRVEADPYDFGARLERLLLRAAEGDRTASAADAAAFARVALWPYVTRRLEAISSGEEPVVRVARIYVVGQEDRGAVDRLCGELQSAVTAICAVAGRAAPAVWVDLHDGWAFTNTTQVEFPGIARINLARALFDEPSWESTVWHEAGHACVISGCRFLDEGWAVWCQYLSDAYHVFPADKAEAATRPLPPSVSALPLEVLLRFRGAGEGFEELCGAPEDHEAIYLRAHRFVGGVIETQGVPALAALFDRVRRGEDPVELFGDLAGVEGPSELAESSIQDIDRVARITRGNAEFQAMAALLARGRALAQARPDAQHLRLLGRLVCMTGLANVPGLPRSDLLGEIDGVIRKLADLSAADPYIPLFRGQRALMEMLDAKPNRRGELIQQSWAEFHRAHAIDPDNGDVLISMAIAELHTPAMFGGKRAKAVDWLARAARQPELRDEVAGIARRFKVTSDLEARLSSGEAEVTTLVTPNTAAVVVQNLRVSPSSNFDLEVASLELAPGARVAVVGANGSGKTTLIEALLGLRVAGPESVIRLLGRTGPVALQDRDFRKRIGVLAPGTVFPPRARVKEVVALHEAMYGPCQRRIRDALGIDELASRFFAKLSEGEKQRVRLFSALGHRPELAFLDEPTTHLDQHFADRLFELFDDLADTTLISTSHAPREVERADQVICLQQGRVRWHGRAADLIKTHLGGHRLDVRLDSAKLDDARRRLRAASGVVSVEAEPGLLRAYGREPFAPSLLQSLSGAESFTVAHTSAEDLLRLLGARP